MSKATEIDDFFPRSQLHKLLERCGKPELACEKAIEDDSGYKVIPMDRNNTMEMFFAGLDFLVEHYVGADLKEDVYEEAKRQIELKLKAEMKCSRKAKRINT